jgi:uncharacterized glyoxalase superfamily protein PhnB
MSKSGTTPANIYPALFYDDAPAAIEWLCKAFGFTRRLVVPGPDGTIVHAELSYGPGVIMVGSARPAKGCLSPQSLPGISQSLCVQVDDPDAHYARAVAGGAIIVEEPKDTDYGARGYQVKDLEGHSWYFGNYRPGAYWTEDANVGVCP